MHVWDPSQRLWKLWKLQTKARKKLFGTSLHFYFLQQILFSTLPHWYSTRPCCCHFSFNKIVCVTRRPMMRWACVVCISATDSWSSLWLAVCYLHCGKGNIWHPVVDFINDSPIYMQFSCQAVELKIFSRWYRISQNFLYTLCTSTNNVCMTWVCDTLCWPFSESCSLPRQVQTAHDKMSSSSSHNLSPPPILHIAWL